MNVSERGSYIMDLFWETLFPSSSCSGGGSMVIVASRRATLACLFFFVTTFSVFFLDTCLPLDGMNCLPVLGVIEARTGCSLAGWSTSISVGMFSPTLTAGGGSTGCASKVVCSRSGGGGTLALVVPVPGCSTGCASKVVCSRSGGGGTLAFVVPVSGITTSWGSSIGCTGSQSDGGGTFFFVETTSRRILNRVPPYPIFLGTLWQRMRRRNITWLSSDTSGAKFPVVKSNSMVCFEMNSSSGIRKRLVCSVIGLYVSLFLSKSSGNSNILVKCSYVTLYEFPLWHLATTTWFAGVSSPAGLVKRVTTTTLTLRVYATTTAVQYTSMW